MKLELSDKRTNTIAIGMFRVVDSIKAVFRITSVESFQPRINQLGPDVGHSITIHHSHKRLRWEELIK